MSTSPQFPFRKPPANLKVLIVGSSPLTAELTYCLTASGMTVSAYIPTTTQSISLSETIQQEDIDVVVLADYSHTQIADIDYLCRTHDVGLVLCGCEGLIGYIWVDFGENFTILDETAEEVRWYDIAHIDKNNPCAVTLHSEGIHAFTLQSGDHVTISGVPGIDPSTVFPLQIVDKDRCRIPVDRTLAADYEQGGVLTEIKVPKMCRFVSYEESWKQAKCMLTDASEADKAREMHISRVALDCFKSVHGRFPTISTSKSELEEVMQLAVSLFPGINIKERYVKALIQAAGCYCQPAGLCIAGLVTAEVIKYSGQGTPLTQWLYIDWTQLAIPLALPTEQYRSSLRLMLVGNSDISREIIRLMTSMNIGSSGLILHASCPISLSPAADNFPSYQSKPESMLPEYDFAYNDDLWNSLDFVLIASSSKSEQRHAAERCVWFEKPHIVYDSCGTKGAIQVVIPFNTQTYSEGQKWSREGFIPLLKPLNGKATTEACIQSAFDDVISAFQSLPQEAMKYSKDPSTLPTNTGDLERLAEFLERLVLVQKYEDCVAWACAFFQFTLYGKVEQVRKHIEEIKSEARYVEHRRIPIPIRLDSTSEEHLRLIELLAQHCAAVLSIPLPIDPMPVAQYLPRDVEEWPLPTSTSVTPNLQPYRDLMNRIHPISITEADEKQCEMTHILACLKARIFSISEPEKAKTKAVLSPFPSSHPAITSLAAGTGLLELLKSVSSLPISTLRNSIFSLVQPLFLSIQPLPCVRNYSKSFDQLTMGPIIALPEGHTAWDKFATVTSCSLAEFLAYFKEKHGLTVAMVFIGRVSLYNIYTRQRSPVRADLLMQEIYRSKGKEGCLEGHKSLELTVLCETEAGDSIEIPVIRYLLPSL